jgi:hypothetical protein
MTNHSVIHFLDRWKCEIIASLFSAYGLLIRVKSYAGRSFSRDEANQWLYTQGPLRPFWGKLINTELTSFPGDYLLTYPFIQLLPNNKWFIMAPHIIAVILGFYLMYRLAKKYLTSGVSMAIVFTMMTFHAVLLAHAFELRPYPVLTTLALACFYLSKKLVCQYERLTARNKFRISIFFVLTTVFHAYGIFMIFFCMMYFLLADSTRGGFSQNIKLFFSYGLKLSLIIIPLFLWYATRNPDVNAETTLQMGMNTFDFIANPLVNPIQFLRDIFGNLTGRKLFWIFLIGPAVAMFIPNKNKFQQIGLFCVCVIIPTQVILLADLQKNYWFVQRQLVWVIPFFILFIGWCWDSVWLYFSEKFHNLKISQV